MNRAKSNLRNQNSRKRFGKNASNPMKLKPEKNKTNKHLLKYEQNESDLFFVRITDDGVLTIVLN